MVKGGGLCISKSPRCTVKKISYVLKVPQEKVILVAGVYAEPALPDHPSPLKEKGATLILCFNGFGVRHVQNDSSGKMYPESGSRQLALCH